MILLALDRAKVKGLGKKQGLGLGKKYIFEVEFLLEKIWLYHCLYIWAVIPSLHLHFLSFQQPPVGRDLHLQVLFDAQQLFIVGLVALHVQTQLRQLILQLGECGLKTVHLHRVLVSSLSQVSFQHAYLSTEHTGKWSATVDNKMSYVTKQLNHGLISCC